MLACLQITLYFKQATNNSKLGHAGAVMLSHRASYNFYKICGKVGVLKL